MKHQTKLTLTSTTPEHIGLKNRPRAYAGTITAHNPYSDLRKKYEPPHEKTNNLHMRNQRRRSVRSNCEADHRPCFRYTDSTISLFSKSKIYSLQSSSVPAQLGLHLCRNPCGVDLLPSHVQYYCHRGTRLTP